MGSRHGDTSAFRSVCSRRCSSSCIDFCISSSAFCFRRDSCLAFIYSRRLCCRFQSIFMLFSSPCPATLKFFGTLNMRATPCPSPTATSWFAFIFSLSRTWYSSALKKVWIWRSSTQLDLLDCSKKSQSSSFPSERPIKMTPGREGLRAPHVISASEA